MESIKVLLRNKVGDLRCYNIDDTHVEMKRTEVTTLCCKPCYIRFAGDEDQCISRSKLSLATDPQRIAVSADGTEVLFCMKWPRRPGKVKRDRKKRWSARFHAELSAVIDQPRAQQHVMG